MSKKQLSVTEENHAKINEMKLELNLNSHDDVVTELLNRYNDVVVSEVVQPTTSNDSLEFILSEHANEKTDELKQLFNTENIEMKTDLTPRQVVALSKAKTFADKYQNKILNDYINKFVSYSVSKERKGRAEFVDSYRAKILEPLGLGSLLGGNNNANDTGK